MGKKSEAILERLLDQLYLNINDKVEMEPIIISSQKARSYIEEKGFNLVVDILNRDSTKKRVKYELFDNAVPSHSFEFLRWYKSKHGFDPIGIGCVMKSKDGWKEFKKALNQDEPWSEAITLPPTDFSYNPQVPLHKIGLIIYGESPSEKTKEHEMLHADQNCYSNVHSEITSWGRKSYGREEILFKQEAEILSEVSSYRTDLKRDKKWVIDALLRDYYTYNTIWIRRNTGMKKEKVVKAMSPLKVKIPQAVEAVNYLMARLQPRLLTPILFSVGPTRRDVHKDELYSSFEDIILWAELMDLGKVKKCRIRKILKEKGY